MGFWHSKEGRYRLYTDQERKEYGRQKSEERRKAWHEKFISKWTLLNERGWTEEALTEFLRYPFVDTNQPTSAFYRYRVEKIEGGKRFKAFMEKQKAAKEDWDFNWVSKATLKDAGWTEAAFKRFLPEPERKGRSVKYRREDVQKAQETDAFKEWINKRLGINNEDDCQHLMDGH